MTRYNTKIGDVFAVKIDDNREKYFQLIAYDLTQLNSDVIRAFEEIYPLTDRPDIARIVNGKAEFHAHCVTKFGLKLGLWEKIGNSKYVSATNDVLFRCTNDAGSQPGKRVIVSERWYVWHINDEDFTRVGRLTGKYRDADLGMVVNPYDIVERVKTGKYSFLYPGFE